MIVGIYADYPLSGKSTAKETFVREGFTELSFATAVKESLEVVLISLGISPKDTYEYLYGSWKNHIIPQLNCTGGYLMSHYAMFMREKFTNDIWLMTAQNRVKKNKLYVVDDLRFYNEYRYIMDNGFTIKIVRPDVNKNHGRSSNSEGQLSGFSFDYTVVNDGTIQDFQEKIVSILEKEKDILNYEGRI